MKNMLLIVLGALCGTALAAIPKVSAHLHAALSAFRGAASPLTAPRAHTEERFSFTAHAPMDRVAPLFGADKERLWAPNRAPQFLYPVPAVDQPRMVFTVAHHRLSAVWVNTEFDLANGRVQYVYVIPDTMVTVITLRINPDGAQTHVDVDYDRTALSPGTEARVREMAEQDRNSGPEWESQINQYLKQLSNLQARNT